jgi:hypothetical protein
MTAFKLILPAAALLVLIGSRTGFAQSMMMKPAPGPNMMGQAANPPPKDGSLTPQPPDKAPEAAAAAADKKPAR